MFLVILCMADTMRGAADKLRGVAATMRGVANMMRNAGYESVQMATELHPVRDRVGIRPQILVTGWTMTTLRVLYYSFRTYAWQSDRETVTIRLMNNTLDRELSGSAGLLLLANERRMLTTREAAHIENTGQVPPHALEGP